MRIKRKKITHENEKSSGTFYLYNIMFIILLEFGY